jgi:predicted nucleic acid-binding protein
VKAYLDTSVILRKLLGQPGAIKEWGRWDEGYTSEITRLESLRTLDRLRLEGKLQDEEVSEKMRLLGMVLESTGTIAINEAVLKAASQSFPTIIGSLDAIHLASALLCEQKIKGKLIILTHDVRLGIAAQAMGFQTRGLASLS